MIAYCWRTGQIGLGRRAPRGTITIVSGPGRRLRRLVEARARLAYDNTTMLVPGIPEAESEVAALKALQRFGEWIKRDLSRSTPVSSGRLL
ncbi:MAG: host nuclease inhibitor protein [Alphaproteobacteria bacterium]|nr:host nuclease inhibitor protein [Alphaproteobacteria bacterium]